MFNQKSTSRRTIYHLLLPSHAKSTSTLLSHWNSTGKETSKLWMQILPINIWWGHFSQKCVIVFPFILHIPCVKGLNSLLLAKFIHCALTISEIYILSITVLRSCCVGKCLVSQLHCPSWLVYTTVVVSTIFSYLILEGIYYLGEHKISICLYTYVPIVLHCVRIRYISTSVGVCCRGLAGMYTKLVFHLR